MKRIVIASIAALLLVWGANAQNKHLNLDKSMRAIQGYDVVNYFTANRAVKGKKDFRSELNGVEYWFSSKENKKMFDSKPEDYAITYGGWCAYAMGVTGDKVKIDPETFKIVDGKLYLFYNFYFNNTLTKWNEEEKTLQMKADKNWETILK